MLARRSYLALAFLLVPLTAPLTAAIIHLMKAHESRPSLIPCGLPRLEIEAPPRLAPATSPLKVVNRTGVARTEYLLVDVILDRRPRMFWTAVTVAPHSDLKIQIKLIGRDDGRNYRICPDRPVGIVEGMDPIMPIAFSYMLD